MAKLIETTRRATDHFEAFDYSDARKEIDNFFWLFTDNYVEFVKHRLYDGKDASAAATIKRVLSTVLKLYAPFIPYITEELYQSMFIGDGAPRSIHKSEWPSFDNNEFDETALKNGNDLQCIIAFIRQWKHGNKMALNGPLKTVTISKAIMGAEDVICGAMVVGKVQVGEGTLDVPDTGIRISIEV
jgi:valyl-tRNA synthetase